MDDASAKAREIFLACPAELPRLCHALELAVAESLSAGTKPRRVTAVEVGQRQRGELGLEFRPMRANDRSLSGQLIVHAPGPTAPDPGPEMGIEAMDRTLSEDMITGFARNLLTGHDRLRQTQSGATGQFKTNE